ncbi:hypothetical protein PFISCL1PPCAC_2442, partial [Pristionchus fissidentatus]
MNSSCSLATEIYESLGFHILQWCIVSNFGTNLLVLQFNSHSFKKSRIGIPNMQELLASLYFYLILYSLSQVFNQVAKDKDTIDIKNNKLNNKSVLLIFRYSANSPCDARVPRLIYAIVYGVLTYLPEPLEGLSAYCSSITKSSEAAVIMNIYVMFFLDVLNVASSFALWKYNYSKLEER